MAEKVVTETAMNAIDIGIAIFALAMAAIGWERGLVRSALPLAGFIGGIALGARLAPSLLDGGAESPYAPAVAAGGGVLLGLFFAVALSGVGHKLSDRLAQRRLTRSIDSIGGAVLFVGLAMTAAWVFGAVALNAPGQNAREVREAVQRSTILVALNDFAPPSGEFLNALRRVDPTRSVRGPEADVGPPDPAVSEDPEVQAASRSVVRVTGYACGLGVEGSGWISGPDLVVTNAHVVAGQEDTNVTSADGATLDARVLHYAPRDDLAVLSVPGLGGTPLELVPNPRKGTFSAAIGYPEGGPLTISPARLGRTGTVESQDSYGRGPIERKMTPFRGEVRHGNSGGPVVDTDGNVVATVFASSISDGPPSGLGVPNKVVARALSGPLEGSDTGPCAA
ncbi:MAG TPA: MarP family serine protease [Solirubrobacterales bacterium]|nr:MarP family serine protease [Solirubrobacterales bacterium]